jgi:tol-pal system protein YbgF
MKLRVLLLVLSCCAVAGQAHAGLFNDDEARQQIQQLAARITALEAANKQQADTNNQQAEFIRQQTRTMLDLQSQIDGLNAQLRGQLGQNEDLAHTLQDAEKRQKDFYIDLDTRLRRFESGEAAIVQPAASGVASAVPATASAEDDIAQGDRAYEIAHRRFKAGKHQDAVAAFDDFLKKFPDSVYVPYAYYEMGNAYFVLADYQKALDSYQVLVGKYGASPKAADAMLGMADCYAERKEVASAKKMLRQIIAKYPGSETASAATKRLSALK